MLQKKRSLKDLQNAAEFIARHIGPSAEDQQHDAQCVWAVTAFSSLPPRWFQKLLPWQRNWQLSIAVLKLRH